MGLVLADLQRQGLYTRPIEWRPSQLDKPVMWDVVSDAAMSTEHANARFLVPHLAQQGARVKFNSLGGGEFHAKSPGGWALFMDGDMLVRGNLARVFEKLDGRKAVYCVHHKYEPSTGIKMDGQEQTRYARKNWSSFCLFNCDHPANRALTLDYVNATPGRDMHRFAWLDDNEIGELGPEWNWLVGHSDPAIDPVVVHFTGGTPQMAGYENVPYADEYRAELARWAA